MQLPKIILSLCFVLVCFVNGEAQTKRKHTTTTAHKNTAHSLQAYRLEFWNHPPEPTGWTNDFDGIFTEDEKQKLDGTISLFERETSIQISVVTLDSLCTSAKKFDSLAVRIARVWGVGAKGKNNGITICICKDYRRMRICNGDGIKTVLSDAETKRIIDDVFTPPFKKNQYFEGTWNGVTALIAAIKG